jgi:hypothetical protein
MQNRDLNIWCDITVKEGLSGGKPKWAEGKEKVMGGEYDRSTL